MIVKTKDLVKIRSSNINKKITFCSGWFDLFHIGHLNFLKKAKSQGDILIVLVRNDYDGKILKGKNRPIILQKQRIEIIDSLKCVDYTIVDECLENNKPFPQDKYSKKDLSMWHRYIPVVELLNPDVVFALEETLKFNGLEEYIENKLLIDVVYCNRFEGISTTELESKIKNQ